jgi:hypothetical protein
VGFGSFGFSVGFGVADVGSFDCSVCFSETVGVFVRFDGSAFGFSELFSSAGFD